MDFLNRVLDQTKQIQAKVGEAMAQGTEAAKPLIADAVAKAQDVQRAIAEQAPHVGGAARAQLDAAMKHASNVVETGKAVLDAGVTAGKAKLTEMQQQADDAHDATASAARTEGTTPPA